MLIETQTHAKNLEQKLKQQHSQAIIGYNRYQIRPIPFQTSPQQTTHLPKTQSRQLKEFGLNQYGVRVNDSQQQADLKKHLLAKGKWRETLGWSRSYSLTFVIPELHRMAIWYVPYHATPEGQKRAGNLTGGIYPAVQNQSDMDAANVVLWKRQHQIAACVGENGQLQFAIWATEEPDPVLVDLIRRGKKIADRQLARSWRFGKGKGYRA